MDWPNERWVKLYVRNSADFTALSWQARGLFRLLLTEVDSDGALHLGKIGPKAIATMVRAPWSEIEGPLGELMEDGCIEVSESNGVKTMVVPNFVQAQQSIQSGKVRQENWRRRKRGASPCETNGDAERRDVTPDVSSVSKERRGVTQATGIVSCHGPDIPDVRRGVTPERRGVTSGDEVRRIEEKRGEEIRKDPNPHTPLAEQGGGRDGGSVTHEAETPHQRVVGAYFEAYRAARGSAPTFGPPDGKAVALLLQKVGGDVVRATGIIANAYRDKYWRGKATIQSIAADPSRHEGGLGPQVQRDASWQPDHDANAQRLDAMRKAAGV